MTSKKSIIDSPELVSQGMDAMDWFRDRMPLVASINKSIIDRQIFKDRVVAICMHIEPKTAFWIEGILGAGAKHVYLVGCLGTTKPETAAYLASLDNITVYGKRGDSLKDHKGYLAEVMKEKIDIFLDNGASLIMAHREAGVKWNPIGANEETRSGKLMIEKHGIETDYPVIVIDDSPVKQLLENAIGVGQSVVDGFMRATSLLVGGKQVLVIGYGFCGLGVAKKFKGLGAITMVYDSNPITLLKAKADGFLVGELNNLIEKADVIVTVTGSFDVITPEHIPHFKDKVILANSGHYGFEIDAKGLRENANGISAVRDGIEKFEYDGKEVYLVENASPINLASGDGNPIEIMDLGLGLQTSSAVRILEKSNELKKGLQPVPEDIDNMTARAMLDILA